MKKYVKCFLSFALAFTLVFTSFDVSVLALETQEQTEEQNQEQENVVEAPSEQQPEEEQPEAEESGEPFVSDKDESSFLGNEETVSENIEESSDDSVDDLSVEDSLNEALTQQEEAEVGSQEVSFRYRTDGDGNATIAGYMGTIEGTLTIPESIEGHKVVSIGQNAFYNCSGITSLTLPNGLTSIGNSAFSSCKGIKGELKIPSGVTSICDNAFSGCSGITNLTLPSSVTSIGKNAFFNCSNITGNLIIPAGVTSIEDGTFRKCSGITGLKLPNGLTSIRKDAFNGCSGITKLTIPDSVTSIGERAFCSCKGITGLKLPNGLTSIGESAFDNCSGITSITLPNGLTSIDKNAFIGCSSITGNLIIPAGVTSIGVGAFYGCREITNLTLPNGLTSIGDKAFYGCSNITGNLIIPASVTSISYEAFMYCSGIRSLTISEGVTSIGGYAFFGCGNITGNLIIPAGVTSIGEYAFFGCGNITGLTLPNGLTSIGDNAFYVCSGITKLTIPDSVTSIGDKAFYGCTKMTGKLIIPASVTSIGDRAFDGTDFIKIVNESSVELKLPAGKDWYDEAFENEITTIGSNGIALSCGLLWYENIPDQDYSASAIEPEVKVYHGKALLKEGEDYSLSYRNNTKVGKAQVIVTGKGNYDNNDVVDFNILPRSILDNDITVSIADKKYTGKPIYSKPVLKYGKTQLKEKTDYTLSYSEDVTNAGTVTVTISGEGNYTGSTSVSYKIYDKTKDISKVYVAPVSQQTYKGLAVTPDITVKATKKDTQSLINDTDYTVTYLNNINAGTATAIITGMGDYGNSKKVTFKIAQKSIADAVIEVSENCIYTGAALRPDIVVKDADTDEVISSENYTVSYINNTNVAPDGTAQKKLPTVKIKGKKNYKGVASKDFKILPMTVSANDLMISVLDVKNSGKAITAKKLSVSVKIGQKKLARGKDYDVSFTQKEGAVQTAKIKLKGNYTYTGEIEKKFMLYTGKSSVADEAFDISLDNATYTGQKITPSVTVKVTIDGEEKTLTEGKDYKLQYSNNINAAEADSKKAPTVKITGMGAYSGSCTETFSIKPKELSTDDFTVEAADMKYDNGNELKPTVSVTYKGKAFAAANYTVEYSNNTGKAERTIEDAKATIRGKGNYSGTIETQFRIYKTDISSLKFNRLAPAVYNGFPIQPKETEIFTEEQLIDLDKDRDYTLSYGENTKAGIGTVEVTGIGNYGGTKTLTFLILPKWMEWIL